MTFDDKVLSSKCREIVKNYDDVLKYFYDEIAKECHSIPINGDNAFIIAKECIRREAMREGAKTIIKKITAKANVRDED